MKSNGLLLNSLKCVVLSCCLFGNLVTAKKLIVVLVDGVRWDYIEDPSLKGIHRIIDNGVRAKYVVPIFPSLSYPNWYTLVTGLYAENHGFVGNNMYDNATNTFFTMIPNPGATDPHWWNDAEPFWVTAEKNQKRSALYQWGGCEVEIFGTHPTICERGLDFFSPTPEARTDFLERVDDMMEMFKTSKRFPVDRLSLGMMYYGSVDHEGHGAGPKSKDVKTAMKDIDDLLDKMQDKIKKAGLKDEVNIMVISDHGMTNVESPPTKLISLEKYASRIEYQMDFGGETMIVPQPGMLNTLVSEMQSEKGLRVYKKEDIPERYHIKNNKKTPPILLVARKGYYITLVEDSSKIVGGKPRAFKGHHGHDPEEVEDMRTVFFATGPDFKKGFVTEPLYNTDLYNVMCSVLQIDPLPNNGSWDRVQPMLRGQPTVPAPTMNFHSGSSRNQNILFVTAFAVILSLLLSLTSSKYN